MKEKGEIQMYLKGKYFQIGTAGSDEKEMEPDKAAQHKEYLTRIKSRFEEAGLEKDDFVDTTLKTLLDSMYYEAWSSKRKYFQWKRRNILLGAAITVANGMVIFSMEKVWGVIALIASVVLTGGLSWQEMKKYDEKWMKSSCNYSALLDILLDYLELNQGEDAEKRLKEQVLSVVKRNHAEFYRNLPEN